MVHDQKQASSNILFRKINTSQSSTPIYLTPFIDMLKDFKNLIIHLVHVLKYYLHTIN